MNESSLLINSAFALRQQDLKPVYTQIGDKIEKPYTASDLKDLKEKLIKLYTKTGMSLENIQKRSNNFEIRMKGKTKKIDGKTDYPIDLSKLERIILTPKASGYISTSFFDFAIANNIAIYWIDKEGIIKSSFMPVYFKRTSLIIKQCEARISGKNIEIAKYLIKLKLESEGMEHLIPKLNKAKNIKDILQVEGNASRAYYQQWSFSNEWNWNGRHGKTSINANAIDPINSMLNLGYSLLAQQMSEILLKRGFELSIGFMHHSETSKTYWNMLSYDFVEPFRIWIDKIVKEMIAENEIKPDDFIFSEDKTQMVFKDKSFKIVLDRFLYVLNPLEYQSLPMIRQIEKILI